MAFRMIITALFVSIEQDARFSLPGKLKFALLDLVAMLVNNAIFRSAKACFGNAAKPRRVCTLLLSRTAKASFGTPET